MYLKDIRRSETGELCMSQHPETGYICNRAPHGDSTHLAFTGADREAVFGWFGDTVVWDNRKGDHTPLSLGGVPLIGPPVRESFDKFIPDDESSKTVLYESDIIEVARQIELLRAALNLWENPENEATTYWSDVRIEVRNEAYTVGWIVLQDDFFTFEVAPSA